MKYDAWENEAAQCEHCELRTMEDVYDQYGDEARNKMKASGFKALVNRAGFIKPCATHSNDDAWKRRQLIEG